ncbi:hypothetical protein D918_05264 [Trichuris suis]|nr:hypothetical protein D918_05264 [Trichuris suis]
MDTEKVIQAKVDHQLIDFFKVSDLLWTMVNSPAVNLSLASMTSVATDSHGRVLSTIDRGPSVANLLAKRVIPATRFSIGQKRAVVAVHHCFNEKDFHPLIFIVLLTMTHSAQEVKNDSAAECLPVSQTGIFFRLFLFVFRDLNTLDNRKHFYREVWPSAIRGVEFSEPFVVENLKAWIMWIDSPCSFVQQ